MVLPIDAIHEASVADFRFVHEFLSLPLLDLSVAAAAAVQLSAVWIGAFKGHPLTGPASRGSLR
jgi:hypothetical protein